jgi:hypothetical protein
MVQRMMVQSMVVLIAMVAGVGKEVDELSVEIRRGNMDDKGLMSDSILHLPPTATIP